MRIINLTIQIQFKEITKDREVPRKFSEDTRKEMVMEGKNMSRNSLKEYLNVNTFKGKPFSGVIPHFRYALHGER